MRFIASAINTPFASSAPTVLVKLTSFALSLPMRSNAALAFVIVCSVVLVTASGVVSNSGRRRRFLNGLPACWKSWSVFTWVLVSAGQQASLVVEQEAAIPASASKQSRFANMARNLAAVYGGGKPFGVVAVVALRQPAPRAAAQRWKGSLRSKAFRPCTGRSRRSATTSTHMLMPVVTQLHA